MGKRFVSALLTAGLMALPATPVFALTEEQPRSFPDVTPDDWYYEACEYVRQRGIFNGMEDGTFSPQTQMTGAMFLQALANSTQNYEAGFFSKGTPDAWYDDAVGWARCVNLIGREETFQAGEPMTRERAAELMYQYAAVTGQLDPDESDSTDSSDDMADTTIVEDTDMETENSAEEQPARGERSGADGADPADSATESDSVTENDSIAELKDRYTDADEISESAADAVLWCTKQGIVQGDGNRFRPDDVFTRAETAQLFQNAQTLLQDARTCAIGYFDASEVEEMRFRNGNNGATYLCTDRETIEYIVGQLNAFRYDEIRRNPFSDGWGLSLEVFGEDGEELWNTLPGTNSMSAPYSLETDGAGNGYNYFYISSDEDCLAGLRETIEPYVSERAE